MTRKDQEGSERIRMNPNWWIDSIKLDIYQKGMITGPGFELLIDINDIS